MSHEKTGRSLPALERWRDRILPLRERAEHQDRWLEARLDGLMPDLLAREGIDLWIVAAGEYNEDPVYATLTPTMHLNAPRRTLLLFFRREDGRVERATLGRYSLGTLYASAWNPESETQESSLRRFAEARDPRTIGIDVSSTFPLADGLSHSLSLWLEDALGDPYASRLRSAERLAVGWLERRLPQEIAAYAELSDLTHALIEAAFSPPTIIPGTTTTDDLVWWLHQTVLDLGLEPSFPFTVTLDAVDQAFDIGHRQAGRTIVRPGDVLRCDVGIRYLGLTTDVQQSVYVRKPGEIDAPEGLRRAMAQGNEAQDLLLAAMRKGRRGNEILRETRAAAQARGIEARFFSHPIGTHDHGAGTVVGLWDQQQGVPGTGDYELHDDTCYAIELCVECAIPEWGGRKLMMVLEEDAAFTDEAVCWLSGRQESFHVI